MLKWFNLGECIDQAKAHMIVIGGRGIGKTYSAFSYLLEDQEERDILKTPEDIEDIKAGKVAFTLEEFVDKKYKKTCYGVKWVDIGE